MKEFNIFLWLLLFNYIFSTQPRLNTGKNQVIEFEIGSKVEYDMDRNYFKFDYFGPTNLTIYFSHLAYGVRIYLTDPKLNISSFYPGEYYYQYYIRYNALLNYNGTYYLNISCESIYCMIGGEFTSFILGNAIDVNEFTKKCYYNYNDKYQYMSNNLVDTYKVRKLSEEKYVYFTLLHSYSDYIPYYPNETILDTEFIENLTIFEVCNDVNNICQKNVKIYRFEKNTEYTIKIHYLKFNSYYSDWYISPQYIFFPITTDNFKQINSGDLGIFFLDKPTFFISDKNFEKKMYLYPNEYNSNSVFFYTAKTNENLDYNNALLLSNLTFVEDYQGYIDQDINSYQINLVLSLNSNSQAKLFLIDEKKQ